MLEERLLKRGTIRKLSCVWKDGCSTQHSFVEKATQRLQELGNRKREPILLRCSATQHVRQVNVRSLQRISEIYEVLYEFHGMMSQAQFRLVPSLETDEWPVRYLFVAAVGRSTHVQLRFSAVYKAHWHIIPPNKEIQVKHRLATQLSNEVILRPLKMQTAERWRMSWEYVVYRVSHGVHFAVIQRIADITSQQQAVYVRVQKAYPRRFIKSVIAPVQKKRTLKASKPEVITMHTVDRGEPCYVRNLNILEYPISLCEHIHSHPSDPALIKCGYCCDMK